MRLGTIIHRWRINTALTTRDLGAQIGISASTVCRIEAGEDVSGETLAAVLCWLMGKDVEAREVKDGEAK